MSLQTTHFRFALARYTNPGDLDNTFSSDGRVVTDFPLNPDAVASGLPTDAAGKLATGPLQGIVVAGWADAGFKFALVRYTASGDLDNTFSGDGKVLTNFPQQEKSVATDAVIDASGRIVVAGFVGSFFPPERFAVARYTSNGTPDDTFSDNGRLTTTFPGSTSASANAVAIDAGGRIVVAGSATFGGSAEAAGTDRFAVARYASSGDLDNSFAGDGRLTTSIPSVESSSARAVAIDASGRIVVAGWGHAPVDNENRFAVARYTTTGGQDNSFAGDGTLTTTFPGAMSATGFAMAIDAHGRIVVAGSANVGGNDRFAVARYTSSGDLDHSFAGDGRLTTTFPGATSASGNAVAIDANGRIVVAGWASFGGKDHFAIARYTATGDLDNSFSGDGRVTTTFPSAEWAEANAVAIDANGRIVVAGSVADLIEVPDPA